MAFRDDHLVQVTPEMKIRPGWGGRRAGAGRKPQSVGMRWPVWHQPVISREIRAELAELRAGHWGGVRRGAGGPKRPALTKICERCLQPFPTKNRLQRFCSGRCRAFAVVRRGPRGGVRHTWRDCQLCRVSFQPKYPQHIFCSGQCSQQYQKQQRWLPNDERRVLRRTSNRKQRVARKTYGCRHELGRWRRICERDHWLCHICLKPIEDTMIQRRRAESPSVDHVVPLSRGGSDDDANVRAAHYGCNSRKRNRLVT